jgi:hypothetical protein
MANADTAGSVIAGTVHGISTGSLRGAGRGVFRNSSGESSGAIRNDGKSSTALPGLPAWIEPITSVDAANGCGRAARIAWLALFTERAESSAHNRRPSVDQNPCRTNIDVSLSEWRGQANERSGRCRRAAPNIRPSSRELVTCGIGGAAGDADGHTPCASCFTAAHPSAEWRNALGARTFRSRRQTFPVTQIAAGHDTSRASDVTLVAYVGASANYRARNAGARRQHDAVGGRTA